ncbi:MAG: DNA alkylation repair protein [Alphaproteobacteria bacterium]|nr:DNA alkylation repair protein [Alphaproteobacteria bacterium]
MSRVQGVLAALEAGADARGVAAWARVGDPSLRSFGWGLTRLRALAKELGRDAALAEALWATDLFDARVLACLVLDPAALDLAGATRWARGAGAWQVSHALCSGPLAKAPHAADLVDAWTPSPDDALRRCGWLLLGAIAPKVRTREEAWLLAFVAHAREALQGEENLVRDAMNSFLLSVGQRSLPCWEAAYAAAVAVGTVEVDYGDNACVAPDVVRHLGGPRIRAKVGAPPA